MVMVIIPTTMSGPSLRHQNFIISTNIIIIIIIVIITIISAIVMNTAVNTVNAVGSGALRHLIVRIVQKNDLRLCKTIVISSAGFGRKRNSGPVLRQTC
jgi:hypothetical protein